MQQLPRHTLFQNMAGINHPMQAQLELTRRCNLDCVHCSVKDGDAAEMDTATIKGLFADLAEAGMFHLNITGGEPFIRTDASELISSVLDTGFFLTIQTNGNLLREEHIDLLKSREKSIRQIGLSLYSVTPEIHDEITRVSGSHSLTLDAIHRLKAAGLPVVVLSVISTMNCSEFHRLQSFCENHGLMFQFNTVITRRDNGDTSPHGLRLPEDRLCTLPKPWETFMDELPAAPSSLSPGSPISSWCSMGSTSCYITAWGDVRPCSTVNIPAGNVTREPFGKIWREGEIFNRIRAFRLDDFECFSCENFPRCHPCPGLAFMEHGSLTAPPGEICRISSVFLNREGRHRK